MEGVEGDTRSLDYSSHLSWVSDLYATVLSNLILCEQSLLLLPHLSCNSAPLLQLACLFACISCMSFTASVVAYR